MKDDDYVPPKREGGRGDADWLITIADSFEQCARSRRRLVIQPRQTWDLAIGLRRAGNQLDVLEYEQLEQTDDA